MTKIPLPLICVAAILGILGNNYLFYQDIIFDKHGGAIMMGPYANIAVFLTAAFTIVCVLLACGNLAPKYVQSYFFDPEAARKCALRRINARVEDVNGHVEEVLEKLNAQAEVNKELREFVENAKKEVGKLK